MNDKERKELIDELLDYAMELSNLDLDDRKVYFIDNNIEESDLFEASELKSEGTFLFKDIFNNEWYKYGDMIYFIK